VQDAPVRVCLMVERQEGVGWGDWVALAEACERHELEGLFRSDHYLSLLVGESRGSLDAWTTLAGVAALTRRIRLGTLVSPVTFRHPSVLAKAVATVDCISGGRVAKVIKGSRKQAFFLSPGAPCASVLLSFANPGGQAG
jgi:alkanesulfonate monooxygenase SsuD/methylene tetrahydromethanopterin reductase-like flavin-dependent oxidoreductase (luciferase family)